MLQSFNDRLKGPFTWIIVISVSFIFVISGMSFFFTNMGGSSSYVAKVGDNEISYQQFQQYAQSAKTKEQKIQILSQMINQYLILAAAQKNIAVSKLALQSAIFNNPMFFDDNGKFSSDKLKQVVGYVGGMDKLEQLITQNIQATIIPQTIAQTSFLTDYENKSLSSIYSVDKQIEYIKISPSSLKEKIKPTTQELEKYYNNHKAEYVSPASKKVSYFIISKDNFISKEKISEDVLINYFNTHQDLFTKFDDKTKQTITKIIQNREALEQFNSFANSVDSIKFGKLETKLGKAKTASITNNASSSLDGIKNSLFFMDNSKYSSIPVSNDKLLIYQVDNSKLATQQTFNEVKDTVTKAYLDQKSQELAIQNSQELLANLENNKKVSQSFSNTTIHSDSETKGFSKGFSSDVLFNNNDQYHLYQDSNGDIYIYKVTKVEPIKSDKKNDIPSQVINAYKQEELNFYLQALKKEIPVKVDYKSI
ncbi:MULTISPECIES: SurA N-terminal domain-containing protein [unclassified Francisella]|uniref:SurA N-terminal domain-containing protein n=1 Tax=unclassified Francisella TaxID=2610885 RepID=UPI002E366973|nr:MULTISPECIES: SurA N-terminal domain-containing protein [unclassified Francisella]MED7819353.1 SurA N-terminal domain-containing protein [Francisella sp. 19S2-4]MED7830107.1 SurA N-terminal domain-containing protein [Francisella sp. 19S2-10]